MIEGAQLVERAGLMGKGDTKMKAHYYLLVLLVPACTTTGVDTDPLDVTGETTYASNCSAPEGPEVTYGSNTDLTALATGKWIHCSGPTILDNEQAGVAYDADGTFHMLGPDGSGGTVELNGFQKQGLWDISDLVDGDPSIVAWYTRYDDGSSEGGDVVFETSPSKFFITIDYNEEPSVYALAQ
ncbi:MAG TPA: hypothetical protein VGG74_11335 [Kofleriaceae bacterium]